MRSTTRGDRIRLIDSCDGEGQSVADAFAVHFSSVHKPSLGSAVHLPRSSAGISSSVIFDENLISDCLMRLRPSLSYSPDGTPAAMIKAYDDIFLPVLISIFSECLNNSTVLCASKTGHVFPVFKYGPNTDFANYRPIFLLSALFKLFE